MDMSEVDRLHARHCDTIVTTPVIARILAGLGTYSDGMRVLTAFNSYVPEVKPGYDKAVARAHAEGRNEGYISYLVEHGSGEDGHELLLRSDLDKLRSDLRAANIELPLEAQGFPRVMADVSRNGPSFGVPTIGYELERLAARVGPSLLRQMKALGIPTEFLGLHVDVDSASHCHKGRAFLEALTDPQDIARAMAILHSTVALYPKIFAET